MAMNSGEIESNEVEKQKSKVDLTSRFTADFVKQNLKKPSSQAKVEFANKVMTSGDIIDPGINSKMQQFLAQNPGKYQGVDASKISVYMLRKEVGAYYTALENKRNNFRALVINQYNISPEQFDNKIKSDINKKDENEIKGFMDSEKERIKYLKSRVGNSIESKKTIGILDKITSSEGQKRFKSLKGDEKEEVEEILGRYAKKGRISDVDLRILFDSNLFTDNEKKELVHTFIPVISLQRAIEVNLIDEDRAKTIKERSGLKDKIKQSGITNQDDIESIYNNISLSDIEVSTSQWFPDKAEIDNLVNKVGFKNLENEFNSILEEATAEEDKKGPQSLREFIVELGKNPKNTGINKINDGGYIKLTRKEETDKVEKSYYFQVIKTDIGGKNKISMLLVGEGDTINTGNMSDKQTYTYNELLQTFGKDGAFIEAYTKGEIDNNSSIKRQPEPFKQETENKLKSEIESLNEELVEKRKDLEARRDKLIDERDSSDDKERIREINQELKNFRPIEDHPEYNDLYNKIVSKENSLDYIGDTNLEKLITSLDQLDPEGKEFKLQGRRSKPEEATLIETQDGDIIVIDGIDITNGKISWKSGKEFGKVDFGTFYEAFKKNKFKRVKPINNLKEFLSEVSNGENSDKWKGFEEKDGKIIYKGSFEKPVELEYFTNKDGKLLKITGNNFDGFEIQEGEYDEKNEKDKAGKDITKTILKIKGAKKRNVSFIELKGIIKQGKYEPDYKIGAKPEELRQEVASGGKYDLKGNLISKVFNNLSLGEILQGGKLIIDGFTDYLKKGNDLHAAKAALAMGMFLPDEFKAELKIKVETSEADAMQKEIEGLSKVDSPIASGRIREWLNNSDTPEYKKEAGLMFMLEKYGLLYAKELYPEKGSFLFYRAFGGSIGDTLFNDVKDETKKEGITFTEEYLMHRLLKKQCSDKDENKAFQPKRRSRLHKDFEAKWKAGITSEIDKGYNDASNKRKAKTMLKGGMDELMGGTIANAIGWFKKSIERGGELKDMSEGFFCMMYSGALYGLSQDVFTKIKSLWDSDGMPMIIARFSSSIEEMKIFNETVLELSKKIEEQYPEKCKGMGTRAQNIFDQAINPTSSEKQRILDTKKFFEDYNEPLLNALNMRVHGDTDKYSKTDNILTFETERKKIPIFQKYYETTKGFTTENTFKKDFMDDGFKGAGIEGIDIFENVKKVLKFGSSTGFVDQNGADNLWKALSLDLKATGKRLFHGEKDVNSNTNRDKQRQYIVGRLRDFVAGCVTNHSGSVGSKSYLSMYNSSTLDIGTDLNKWGLNINDSFGMLGATQILNGDGDRELKKVAENIINGGNGIDSVEEKVQMKTADILGGGVNIPANDEVYRERKVA